MADLYGLEYVGGPDGTQNPPKKLDGRLVGAKKRRNRATKPAVQLNVGDRFYIGKIPQGASVRALIGNADTSLGSATLSIGTTANPTKYANARSLTVTDTPTSLGPRAAAHAAAPLDRDEALWATVGGAAIPAATVLVIESEYTIST